MPPVGPAIPMSARKCARNLVALARPSTREPALAGLPRARPTPVELRCSTFADEHRMRITV